MPKLTQKEMLLRGLENAGWDEVPTRAGATFRQFKHPGREGYFGYVTRGGSFRVGKKRATARFAEELRSNLIWMGNPVRTAEKAFPELFEKD